MAKNNPVISWIIKHSPNKDPKFHHDEIFIGAGRSTRALFIILKRGWLIRRGLFISFFCRKEPINEFDLDIHWVFCLYRAFGSLRTCI